MARLGELGKIITGNTPKTSEPENYAADDICFVKPSDISDGSITQIERSEFYISEHAREKARILPPGSVLVTCIGIIGKVAINSVECACNQQINAIVPDYKKCTSEYLAYAIQSRKWQLQSIANAPVVPIINKSQFSDIVIPVPPLSQQKYISDTLKKSSDLIHQYKQHLSKLDELVKARFVEKFGDFDLSSQKSEWPPISEIGTVVGGATPKTDIAEYWNGSFPWVTPADIVADTGYIYSTPRSLTQAGIDSCSLQQLPEGTVILSSRAPIGKVALAGRAMYCNQGFKNIICNSKILPQYLYFLLLYNTQYFNSLGRGATFKEISKKIVENIRIPVPSIELQNKFITFVTQVEKTRSIVQRALDKAQLLFDSLMQQYFG